MTSKKQQPLKQIIDRCKPKQTTDVSSSTRTISVVLSQQVNNNLFVVIDAYSHFPEVEIAQLNPLFQSLIEFLPHMGFPRVVRNDNGPPFSGEEIKQFMFTNGIDHKHVTPLDVTPKHAEIFITKG